MPLRISEEEEKDDDDDEEEDDDSDDEGICCVPAPRCMIPQVVSFAWSTRVCGRHESTVTSTVPCAPKAACVTQGMGVGFLGQQSLV